MAGRRNQLGRWARAKGQAAVDWWADRLKLDWIAASSLITAHVLVVELLGHGDVLGWLSEADRRGLYSSGAGVASLLATVNTLGIGLYSSSTGSRMTLVRRVRSSELRRSWRGMILTPYFAAGLCLVCLGIDHTARDTGGAHFVFEFAFLIGALRLLRAVHLYDQLLRVNEADMVAPDLEEAPV